MSKDEPCKTALPEANEEILRTIRHFLESEDLSSHEQPDPSRKPANIEAAASRPATLFNFL